MVPVFLSVTHFTEKRASASIHVPGMTFFHLRGWILIHLCLSDAFFIHFHARGHPCSFHDLTAVKVVANEDGHTAISTTRWLWVLRTYTLEDWQRCVGCWASASGITTLTAKWIALMSASSALWGSFAPHPSQHLWPLMEAAPTGMRGDFRTLCFPFAWWIEMLDIFSLFINYTFYDISLARILIVSCVLWKFIFP